MLRANLSLPVVSTVAVLVASLITACGSGSSVSISGNLSGLISGSSIVLLNNSDDPLTVTNNGAFTFAKSVGSGAAYSVTIVNQPTGQFCQVANGAGTAGGSAPAIGSVVVTCLRLTIAGTVTGLAAGATVTLSNGLVSYPITANGPFAFPGSLPIDTAFKVSVATQPAGQTCTIANPTGTVSGTAPSAVAVTCQ
jgi:hypothetical protein